MVVFETLLSMLWQKQIKMIAAMYVSSADLISVHYARILHGGQLHVGGCLPGTIQCVCTPK